MLLYFVMSKNGKNFAYYVFRSIHLFFCTSKSSGRGATAPLNLLLYILSSCLYVHYNL